MVISATEFKKNMGKYFAMVKEEEIIVTKNGKRIGVLVDPFDNTIKHLQELFKDVPKDWDRDKIREMRAEEYEAAYNGTKVQEDESFT